MVRKLVYCHKNIAEYANIQIEKYEHTKGEALNHRRTFYFPRIKITREISINNSTVFIIDNKVNNIVFPETIIIAKEKRFVEFQQDIDVSRSLITKIRSRGEVHE